MQINSKNFSEEEIKFLFKTSFSKQEVSKKLGFSYCNGRTNQFILNLAERLSISMDHFDPTHSNKTRRIYPQIKKICPVCLTEFETLERHRDEKTTCSPKCSNTYFAESKHTAESNLKRSLKLTKPLSDIKNKSKNLKFDLKCVYCNNDFKSNKRQQKCCSQSCAGKFTAQNLEYIENLRALALQRVADGTHNGWSSRDKLKPSFPEKVVMEILEELNFSLIREYKVGKYFIDFADIDRKIALEIDGKQHEYPERKIKDQEKDLYLSGEGWQVIRVKWKKLNKEVRLNLKNYFNEVLK